jgi:hypothetical protein
VGGGARLPDLVPFWKPPNISASTTRTTMSSRIHVRHPPARDRGRHRRRGPSFQLS